MWILFEHPQGDSKKVYSYILFSDSGSIFTLELVILQHSLTHFKERNIKIHQKDEVIHNEI